MSEFNRKEHWETIYQTKELKDVSWYQKIPEISLGFFDFFKIASTAKIIDIGGGDSLLADHLLDLGYENITVLDISENAILKAKDRLGSRANEIKWIVSDITDFNPSEKYDVWHDRAAFHFLTEEKDISKYINIAKQGITDQGVMILGTFSEKGPKKCSGIDIKQYSEQSIKDLWKNHFEKVKCFHVDHQTPFNTTQNFLFCGFKKQKVHPM